MDLNEPLHIFGEVLFDQFPDGSRVLGGAPFNVAWHLQAFGQNPKFISRVGNDAAGQEILDFMTAWGMNASAVQIDNDHPTGSVQIQLQSGEPHYEIVPNSAYDFVATDELLKQLTQGILYHGTLAIRHHNSLQALRHLKAQHQGKIFVDVNLRTPWWSISTVKNLLADADWVKLNQTELFLLNSSTQHLETAMRQFRTRFSLEMLVVTLGDQGAVAIDQKHQFYQVKPNTTAEIVDTVGAGDAFTSILLLGLSQQWDLATTLMRAQAFASTIVTIRGATIADKFFYQAFSQAWHADNSTH